MPLSRDQTIARLRRGDQLRMEMRDGVLGWWFESPYAVVSVAVMRSIMADPTVQVAEAGDSLFGLPLNSQTWMTGEGS